MFFYRNSTNKPNKKYNIIKSLFQFKDLSPMNSTPQKGIHTRAGRRMPFSTLFQGSLTVEAAVAIPIFLLAVISLVSMMRLYGAAVSGTIQLQNEVEKLAMYASLTGSESDTYIDISKNADGKVLGLISTLVKIPVRGRVRVWNGKTTRAEDANGSEGGNKLVYVTDEESVYHSTSRCTHLELSIQKVSSSEVEGLRNSDRAKYHACEKCVGGGTMNGSVYITPNGDCYHNSLDCSGLTRTIRMIREDEAEDLPLCSRCEAMESEAG